MTSFAIELLGIFAVIVLVRALVLPLLGRIAIWRGHSYRSGDVVVIGESQGQVARIGFFHTILVQWM